MLSEFRLVYYLYVFFHFDTLFSIYIFLSCTPRLSGFSVPGDVKYYFSAIYQDIL